MPRLTRYQDCGNYGSPVLSRRELLRRGGLGFGTLALAALLAEENRLVAEDGTLIGQPIKGRAKSVIFLFMGGGPSHVDTWDPKPELGKLNGKDVPESIAKNVPRVARARLQNLFASPYKFSQHGQSGIPVSELFPEVAKLVDDLCILRGCRHDSPIHAPAEYWSTTGSQVGDRPSLGAWMTYGLGSENRDLPGFIMMMANENFAHAPTYASGFLPATYQGTVVKSEGIANLAMPAVYIRESRRAQLDLIAKLNEHHRTQDPSNSELEARINSYELAFRMQSSAPEAFDLSQETAETKTLYGIDGKETDEFGKQCLLARRLVERGVRFVQMRHGGWDAHADLKGNHDPQARKVDRPIAGLLTDLKRRGLLEQTLVVWGGEFGRTPAAENARTSPGRDHSPSGYSMWLSGAGVKGGQVIGATDPVGYAVTERPITPNDLHATLLHAFGIGQRELYYVHNNRKEIVTVNGGEVIKEVFG